MKNEELDIFIKASLFLYTAALKREGIKADLKVEDPLNDEKLRR